MQRLYSHGEPLNWPLLHTSDIKIINIWKLYSTHNKTHTAKRKMLFFIEQKKEFHIFFIKKIFSYIQYPVCDTHAVNTHQVWAQTLNWTVKKICGPWVERSWSNPIESNRVGICIEIEMQRRTLTYMALTVTLYSMYLSYKQHTFNHLRIKGNIIQMTKSPKKLM